MKNIILLVILLTGVGFAVSYYMSKESHNRSQLLDLSKNIDFDKSRLKASHELRLLEFKNQLSHISSEILYKEITGEAMKSSVVCANGRKLIFCIPESVCNTCHENTFKQLSEVSKIISASNIIILVDSPRLRSTYIEFKDRGSEIKILGVNVKELRFDIHYVPFFFVLSPDSSCENLFVPNSFDPELTSSYIDVVNKKYFHQ